MKRLVMIVLLAIASSVASANYTPLLTCSSNDDSFNILMQQSNIDRNDIQVLYYESLGSRPLSRRVTIELTKFEIDNSHKQLVDVRYQIVGENSFDEVILLGLRGSSNSYLASNYDFISNKALATRAVVEMECLLIRTPLAAPLSN